MWTNQLSSAMQMKTLVLEGRTVGQKFHDMGLAQCKQELPKSESYDMGFLARRSSLSLEGSVQAQAFYPP